MISKNYWMFAVPILLAAHVSLMSWAVVKATRDQNGGVIPDYYKKSLRWDADRMSRSAAVLPTSRP